MKIKFWQNHLVYIFVFRTLSLLLTLSPISAYSEDIGRIWDEAREKTMKGNFDEAWKEYEELVVKNPNRYNVVFGAGCLKYYQAEKNINNLQIDNLKTLIKEAENYFDTAIQLAKTPEERANGLYNKGNGNLLLANAVKENPQLIEESINYYKNAIRLYREALENKPDFPEANKNLEHALYQLKQLMQKREEEKNEENQNPQSDKEQRISTMFLETKTDLPDAEISILDEKPNVVELKKKSN